ncbi:MAG: ABC transporter permease [Vicinamibacterales bacterium]
MTSHRLGRLLDLALRCGARLAPPIARDRWHAQWRADLWHRLDALERAGLLNARTGRELTARTAGALWHAAWLRLTRHGGDMIRHDVRHAARALAARPLFTAIAVATLALGIGANAVIFSWIEATLLDPMPGIARPREVVALTVSTATRNDISLSYLNYRDIRDAAPAGTAGVAVFSAGALSLRGPDGAERMWAAVVSGNLFDVLGVGATLGRVLTPDDELSGGGQPVVVLSHRAWQRRFGGRPDIVGSTLVLNERAFTVVGVAAERFIGPQPLVALDAFLPVTAQPGLVPADRLEQRGSGWLTGLARLAPGASVATAQAGIDVVARRLAADHPDINEGRGLRVFPLWRQPNGGTAMLLPVMAVLAGVVGVLLALVCANMAGLLLARATGRRRELAVRVSLGASRGQLIRLLLAETTLLAVVAGLAAAVVTMWSRPLLFAFIPPLPIPVAIDAGLNPRVLAFASALSLVAGLAVGLLPGLQISRGDLLTPLKDGSSTGGTTRGGRLRQGLIVAQVAVALVLLVSAGLFVRTLGAARRLDVGFAARSGIVGMLDVGSVGLDQPRALDTYRRLAEAVRTLPGVEAAAVGQRLPLTSTDSSDRTVGVEGYTPADGEEMTAYYASIGPRYFETLQMGLVDGRDFTDRDTADAPLVAIVNETMARRYWQGRSAIGGTVKVGDRAVEVVGIARDAKYRSVGERPLAFMYFPVDQVYRSSMRLVVRTAGPPDAIVPALRETIARVAPGVPLFDVQTLEQHRAFAFFLFEMAATLLTIFGGIAALLAALGLYGVIAQAVAARTREIGVRMSLGATRGAVGRLVVGQGLTLAGAGIGIGLVAAGALTRLLQGQLLGVSPLDPAAFLATTGLLALTAVAASAAPAWRAARVDPARALRTD